MNPARCAFTYIGTATLLLEIGTLRLLTDPALDPAGNDYSLEPAPGIVIGSRKLVDPALSREGLGSIDAVLLSHDEHFDNLDGAGRELLSEVGVVLTTPPGAQRLGGQAVALGPWTSIDLDGNPKVRVTACTSKGGLT